MSHPVTILVAMLLILLTLDVAALRWGVDSRFLHRPDEDDRTPQRNWS